MFSLYFIFEIKIIKLSTSLNTLGRIFDFHDSPFKFSLISNVIQSFKRILCFFLHLFVYHVKLFNFDVKKIYKIKSLQ